jgi:putative IMPACT (imprinted ancient) family translation regulator
MKNTYRTINIKAEFLFKEKQSKFFGYAFPVSEHEDIKKQIEKLKKKHHSARHF